MTVDIQTDESGIWSTNSKLVEVRRFMLHKVTPIRTLYSTIITITSAETNTAKREWEFSDYALNMFFSGNVRNTTTSMRSRLS